MIVLGTRQLKFFEISDSQRQAIFKAMDAGHGDTYIKLENYPNQRFAVRDIFGIEEGKKDINKMIHVLMGYQLCPHLHWHPRFEKCDGFHNGDNQRIKDLWHSLGLEL